MTALAPISAASPQPAKPATPAAAQPFGLRIVVGMLGVLIASLSAGLNEKVTDLAMTDVRGALSIGHDEGTWLLALYSAAQVAAMAFAPWFSVTVSLRRFTLGAIAAFALLALLCPFAPNVETLYLLRLLQGFAGGCMPPMLMTVALRFLPPGIKLYGLGAYALTATFAPNLGMPWRRCGPNSSAGTGCSGRSFHSAPWRSLPSPGASRRTRCAWNACVSSTTWAFHLACRASSCW